LLSLSDGIFYLNINGQAAWESDFSWQPAFLSARDCEMVDGEQSKKRRETIVSVRYVCYTDHRAEAQKSWEV
jgi:hypothetical protein